MYKPDPRTKINFFILFIFASAIAWLFYLNYKPVVIEKACSAYAQKSIDEARKRDIGPECNPCFEDLKNDCVSTSTQSN